MKQLDISWGKAKKPLVLKYQINGFSFGVDINAKMDIETASKYARSGTALMKLINSDEEDKHFKACILMMNMIASTKQYPDPIERYDLGVSWLKWFSETYNDQANNGVDFESLKVMQMLVDAGAIDDRRP